MNRNLSLIAIGLLAAISLPLVAHAHVLTVQPVKAAVLPADESGRTRVALQFDLSGLPSGENRQIHRALLNWRVNGVPSDRHSEYSVYPITGAWTVAGAGGGTPVSIAEETAASWDIDPLDYQRNGGGFIRLDITNLVQSWVGSAESNYGVVITTADVNRQTAADQLAEAELTVRYGFIR
jgi:hypothetical protein